MIEPTMKNSIRKNIQSLREQIPWGKIQCGEAYFATLGVDFKHVVHATEI